MCVCVYGWDWDQAGFRNLVSTPHLPPITLANIKKQNFFSLQEQRALWERNCMNIQMTSNSAGVFQEENIYTMYSDGKLKVSK